MLDPNTRLPLIEWRLGDKKARGQATTATLFVLFPQLTRAVTSRGALNLPNEPVIESRAWGASNNWSDRKFLVGAGLGIPEPSRIKKNLGVQPVFFGERCLLDKLVANINVISRVGNQGVALRAGDILGCAESVARSFLRMPPDDSGRNAAVDFDHHDRWRVNGQGLPDIEVLGVDVD